MLRRARFGRSSEKLDRQIEQLELALGELEESKAQSAAGQEAAMAHQQDETTPVVPRPQKGVPVRKPLPEHLPRERVEHPTACVCPSCGGTRLPCIGTDEREVLEYVPSHFKVVVHARPKMSCRNCETITQPPLPSLPIERGLPGPGLLAHVLVASTAITCRCTASPVSMPGAASISNVRRLPIGWGIWPFCFSPRPKAIGAHVRAGDTLHANDTSVPVLDPGRGQTKTGRLWVAVRDERSWGSPVPPAVYYQYSPDRRAARAEALLRGCHGYLHADAYAGFNGLYEANTWGGMPLIEVGCWAHARRKIYEVHDATKSPRAKELLKGDRQPVRDRGADQGPQRTRALGRSPAAIGAVAHEP